MEFRKTTPTEFELVKTHIETTFKLQNFEKIIETYEIMAMVGKWKEILLVSSQMVKIFYKFKNFRDPYFMGIHLGDLNKNKFKISLEGITIIEHYVDEKSILSEKGEKKVLYGRDLAKEDLVYLPKEIKKGDFSILINKQGEALALGRYLVDREIIRTLDNKSKVIKNVIDKGWYLRKGD